MVHSSVELHSVPPPLEGTAPPSPHELRAELDRLQKKLSTRESTHSFAHAGVSCVAALIFSGAVGKLIHDLPNHRNLTLWTLLIPAGLLVYAAVRFARGRRELKVELRDFDELRAMRHKLHLDDPASLLPR